MKWYFKNIWSNIDHHCLLCDMLCNNTAALCQDCFSDLPWLSYRCSRCALAQIKSNQTCPQCLKHPPPFQQVTALFSYSFPIDALLQQIKSERYYYHLKWLAYVFVDKLPPGQLPQALIPIPMSRYKQLSKGYNQAEALASLIGKILNIKVEKTLCSKVLDTKRQTELNVVERLNNLKKAFIAEPHDYQHLAIVDDTMTTGATVTALTKALQLEGTVRIDIWVIARTAQDHFKLHK